MVIAQSAYAQGQLNIYNWGDYINPEVLTRFTEETGIKVSLDTYGTNEEMLAKIQVGCDRIRHSIPVSSHAGHYAETGFAVRCQGQYIARI